MNSEPHEPLNRSGRNEKMIESAKLRAIVSTALGELAIQYGWEIFDFGQQGVLLRGKNYWIQVMADREDTWMYYIDSESHPLVAYDIFSFLSKHRRDQMRFEPRRPFYHGVEEKVNAQVAALARHIKTAGEDILNGSKDWTKGARAVDAGPRVREFVLAHSIF